MKKHESFNLTKLGGDEISGDENVFEAVFSVHDAVYTEKRNSTEKLKNIKPNHLYVINEYSLFVWKNDDGEVWTSEIWLATLDKMIQELMSSGMALEDAITYMVLNDMEI